MYHIQSEDVLDVIEHDVSGKYQGQRILVVNVEGYVCLVPFIESENSIFLKTIIPSRKMAKRYLGAKRYEAD